MTERVSDWTLGDAIERLEASGPNSAFLVGPMDKPLVLAAFRELRERRAERCETCGASREPVYDKSFRRCLRLDRTVPIDGYCWMHESRKDPQPCQ